jgi:hypothetical protein
LKKLLATIERVIGGNRGTPGPVAKAATAASAAVKRGTRQGAGRARKVITDPKVLAKRRAALEKARKVLAAKRAAAAR